MTKITDIPAIRFKGFSDTWEQRKLGEVAKYRNGKAHENCIDESGKYIVVNSKFVSTNGTVIKHSNMQNEPLAQNEIAFVLSDVPNGRAIARTFLVEENDKYTLNQRIAGITSSENTYPYFLHILMNRHPYFLAFDDGVKQTNLSVSDVLNFETYYPEYEEQKQIGEYFRNLDRLITLHQREFAFLCKEKSKKFRYIKNAWEQRKAIDIADYSKGNGYSKGDLTDAGTPIILYGRLYTKYQFAISEVDTFAVPRNGAVYSQGNEVIVPASGETAEDIARASAVEKSGVLLGGDLNILRPFDFINPLFLALAISNGEPQKELAKKAQGKSVVHIHNTDIQEVTIAYPSRTEQDRIVSVFRQLDNLITLHQREFAFLCKEKSKKFRYIKNAWEQRKFDEVFDCTVPNNTLSRAELSYDEGTVLNVHYGDVLIKYGSVLDVQKDDIPRIPHRCREDFNGALLQDGDVIIADTAEDETTGKACEIGNLQGSAIVSGLHTMVCRPRNRMALGYLGYYLNSNAYHHQLLPLMQGIKVLSLSRSNIQKTSVSYPIAVKEQQLIAYYFSQLDNLITLHQRELEKLKNLKKACLEKMFV